MVAQWDITVLFVTHSQLEVRRASQWVVVLEKGRVVAAGTPEEALGQPELLAWSNATGPVIYFAWTASRRWMAGCKDGSGRNVWCCRRGQARYPRRVSSSFSPGADLKQERDISGISQKPSSRIPAASSGTMNNLTIGGMDERSGTPVPFAYYETIAGGSGASAAGDGVSGVHTHMTNSLNTPAEALEYSYPLRVTKYSLRPVSGVWRALRW